MLLREWTCQCRLALSYWTRWWLDWPRWMAIPPSCVECSRILKGTAYRSVLLLGVEAWSKESEKIASQLDQNKGYPSV